MAGMLFARFDHFLVQAFSITRRIARTRRTVRTLLAEREIVAQDFDPARTERIGYRHQKRRIPIRSGAVGENQKIQDVPQEAVASSPGKAIAATAFRCGATLRIPPLNEKGPPGPGDPFFEFF